MGRKFAPWFRQAGCQVELVGRSTDPSYGGRIAQADLILFSVPIAVTTATIRSVLPYVRPEQLLSDFTSIKAEPVAAMLESSASVIGCHPIFGPTAPATGQNAVLCPARPGPWLPWYRHFLRNLGIRVVELQAAEHDQAMAFIQGLTHFLHIAFARTLHSEGANLETLLALCSPVYRLSFATLCRILDGDPRLYAEIQSANPANVPLLQGFLHNAQRLYAQVSQQQATEIAADFREAANYLGAFRHTARNESDAMVRSMTAELATRQSSAGGSTTGGSTTEDSIAGDSPTRDSTTGASTCKGDPAGRHTPPQPPPKKSTLE